MIEIKEKPITGQFIAMWEFEERIWCNCFKWVNNDLYIYDESKICHEKDMWSMCEDGFPYLALIKNNSIVKYFVRSKYTLEYPMKYPHKLFTVISEIAERLDISNFKNINSIDDAITCLEAIKLYHSEINKPDNRPVIAIKERAEGIPFDTEIFDCNDTLMDVFTTFGKNHKFNNGYSGKLVISIPFKSQDL